MISPADVKARFPEFTATPDATVQAAIDDAVPFFNVCRWGTLLDQGMANFVAHNLWSAARATAGMQAADLTTSKKAGDVSVSYDPLLKGKIADQIYLASIYGQRYLQYKKLVRTGAITI